MSIPEHAEAVEMLTEAVTVLEAEGSDATTGAMLNLGATFDLNGQSGDAESWYLRAMGILQRREVAKRSPGEVAQAMEDLANCYVRRGDYSLAEAALKRALDIATEALGEEHPVVLHMRGQYGCVARQLEKQ